MKKITVIAIFVLLLCSGFDGSAQSKRRLIMFYNVENLFDTLKDPSVRDDEFLPNSAKAWNSQKYWHKMANLERVFSTIAEENKQFPAIIGLSEVENRNVLEDVVSREKMLQANYQIVHYDSHEARGVDVALLYRPDEFVLEGSYPVTTVVEELPDFKTRDILTVWGTMDDEPYFFMVIHWPSRWGGQSASEFKRVAVAKQMRQIADSVLNANPATKIVMMGDFNDDPSDKSIAKVLGGQLKPEDVGPTDFFNPFYQRHKDGYGTLAYQDAWNLFDNIIVSGNLLVSNNNEGFMLWKPKKSKYYGFIFDRSFMRQQEGQYKGYPLRTFVGNDFQGGYSDHFPVYIFIAK